MKKTSSVLLTLSLLALTGLLTGCPGSKPAPVTERIAKAWTARIVEHGSTTVYTKGNTSSAFTGYSNFLLDLSKPSAVTYRELDGNTFTGTYSIPTDNRLILNALTPQPSGTGGTIEFTIDALSDSELKLTRTTPSVKTGNTTNKYTLANP
jgi:hypothetical protein